MLVGASRMDGDALHRSLVRSRHGRPTHSVPESATPVRRQAIASSATFRRPPSRGGTGGRRSRASELSSAATRLWRSRPQPPHRWTITCSPFGRAKTPTASISARHSLARSPGCRSSTWREVRHSGQWFRCRPPEMVGPTKVRQRPHLNDSRPSGRWRLTDSGRPAALRFGRLWRRAATRALRSFACSSCQLRCGSRSPIRSGGTGRPSGRR